MHQGTLRGPDRGNQERPRPQNEYLDPAWTPPPYQDVGTPTLEGTNPRPPARPDPAPRSPDFVIEMAFRDKGILKEVRPRQTAAQFTVR